MDFLEVRRTVVVAVASDDILCEKLVLKGGNALELVHRIGGRASLDVDFSMEGDLDPGVLGPRLIRALSDRFDSLGYQLFDEKFAPRPPSSATAKWGGYFLEFKLIEKAQFSLLSKNVDDVRRRSLVTGAGQKRTMRIEISKNEYTTGKTTIRFDEYDCAVYTPVMIAVEKLRAICQQMPEYKQRRNPAPRPRDFYDIRSIADTTGVDLRTPDCRSLAQNMFAAKDVPLSLLLRISATYDFHASDWPAVGNAVAVPLGPFDDYFDFVVKLARDLHALWVE